MCCSITKELLGFIKRWEGVVKRVYLDPIGLPTVGVGHLVRPEDNLRVGQTVSEAKIDKFLEGDLKDAIEAVNSQVTVPLSNGQCIALISFVFNLGVANFKRSTLLRLLNSGDKKEAAEEFVKWNRAGGRVLRGLTNRRLAEKALFLK